MSSAANVAKRVPMRTCVICRQQREKRQLTRIVHTPEGVMIDPTGKRNGRGAYVCDDPTCRHRAATTTIVGKALRTSLTDADRQRLHTLES